MSSIRILAYKHAVADVELRLRETDRPCGSLREFVLEIREPDLTEICLTYEGLTRLRAAITEVLDR